MERATSSPLDLRARAAPSSRRVRIGVQGAVQGVGFRPFVYRLATDLGLFGWVGNSSRGVVIDAEGDPDRINQLIERIRSQAPPLASVSEVRVTPDDVAGCTSFRIRECSGSGEKTALILPDVATCPECLSEIFDPADRRYQYPFTNCTNCGPRYSIIEALPYDRVHTTMRSFGMCPACRSEYEDPRNRRFHAQPNACPVCGPHIELWCEGMGPIAGHDALQVAASVIRHGGILALKGLGGFHLVADARNDEAVRELRRRKHREEKPFATMFPSLDQITLHCHVSQAERELLCSPQAPIVLLRLRPESGIAFSVAPNNPYLGVMLPYTPLHHLLMADLGFPIVATSGNGSDELICIDEDEAVQRLRGIADAFLVHNRPIARQVDDSVVRVMAGRPMMLRRSRGYAPLPIHTGTQRPAILGMGGHLKSTVALSLGQEIILSQHIGDLGTAEALGAYGKTVDTLSRLYDFHPSVVAHDAHPDYASTRMASVWKSPTVSVQHHYAHILSCMAEHGLQAPVLGVSWDGTGYGADGTIWGGEFLLVTESGYGRMAHLKTFRLPGGETAVEEPRRAALGLLYETLGDRAFEMETCATIRAFSVTERSVLHQMLRRGVNAPVTSSAGRLFDALASIVGIRQRVTHEGQAAMELEWAMADTVAEYSYPIDVAEGDPVVVDWRPMVTDVVRDVKQGVATGRIAAAVHLTLAGAILRVAQRSGVTQVALTGGCFQNRALLEATVGLLESHGLQAYWNEQVPPNDGGLALGQVVAAARLKESERCV